MQYKGVYACGHEGTVKISGGKAADREWKASKAFEYDCPECQKKAREEEIRVINEESASDSKKLRFPELEGSPKQIAWANTIRLKFYDFCVERGISPDEVIDNETSASWWIDTHTCDEQFVAGAARYNLGVSGDDRDTGFPGRFSHGLYDLFQCLYG